MPVRSITQLRGKNKACKIWHEFALNGWHEKEVPTLKRMIVYTQEPLIDGENRICYLADGNITQKYSDSSFLAEDWLNIDEELAKKILNQIKDFIKCH